MVGFGYDVHKLERGESLILGGVSIDSEIGTVAHSDGDVLLHAIMDAILGAIGQGDIGEHFPDTDVKYKNADSTMLMLEVLEMLNKDNCVLVNIDSTIVMEKPKLLPFKAEIRAKIAKLCKIEEKRVNIKATTNEKMGFVGRKEGIAVYSICEIKDKQ